MYFLNICVKPKDEEVDSDFVVPKSNERRDKKSRKAEERRRQREAKKQAQEEAQVLRAHTHTEFPKLCYI